MDKTKFITFDKASQDTLPEDIKAKMKADREKLKNNQEKELFLKRIIRSGYKTYFVKFYDEDKKLLIHADNFKKAGILAMAYIILKDGVGFGIEYIENTEGMKVPFEI